MTRLAERHDLALAYLRRPGEGPLEEGLRARCARVEEIALPGPGRLPAARRRARLAAGLARGRPMWASEIASAAAAIRIGALAREWKPELVHVELRVTGLYLPALSGCPAPRVLVDHDPPAATARDLARAARGPQRLLHALDARAWRRLERETTALVDAVVVLTERDRRTLAAARGGGRLVRIAPGFDVPPESPGFAGPPGDGILFVGGFGHLPNVDAALHLARNVLPMIRVRFPAAVLHLVGHAPPRVIRDLASPSVVVEGAVADVGPHLARAAVVVAPIRTGGGVRVKLLEALAAGKPVVTTPRGAEGLDAVPGRDLLIAASDVDFAAAVAELLEDPARRAAVGASARRWAVTRLDWEEPAERYEALYAKLLGR